MARQEYTVADVADFPVGTHRVVKLAGREIGIFNVHGTFYALPNLCPHQVGPLCTGRVSGTLIATPETRWQRQWVHEGEIITCPWHGLEYYIPTGQCLAHREVRLRTFEVWVEDSKVKIRV